MTITKAAREAVRARLAEAFNSTMAARAASYSVSPIVIDWTKQLFQGRLMPDDIVGSTAVDFPIVCLYGVSARNANLNKFNEFSGTVQLGLDFHFSWPESRALSNFDEIADLTEVTLLGIFHSDTWPAAYTRPLSFNGDIEMQRTPVVMASKHWRQTMATRMTFEVDQ